MADAQTSGFTSIIIVGAGPSGLLLALLLTTLSPRPRITILEQAAQLDTSPRATHYGAPAIRILRKAGVLKTVRERGFMTKTICWRKLDGSRITGMNRELLHDGEAEGDGLTVCPVGELGQIMVEALEERGETVRWGEKVVAVGGQDEGDQRAWVEVVAAGARANRRYEANFVVGCDGGNSAVRRLLYGNDFPGFTWDVQIVATNTYYDFDQFNWEHTQFIIDKEHWYMAAKIRDSGDPKSCLWRISYGELPGLSREELMARQAMKFEKLLPGNPTPDQYRVVSISPYKVHQRCVRKMALNRVCLAADAAHLCNPFGGLGLTGGIVDIGGLFDCLRGIHAHRASLSILQTYSDVRIEKFQKLVNPVSSANIRRMLAQDPETALKDDEFLRACKRAETDEEFSRQLQSGANGLEYDFSMHWDQPGVGNTHTTGSSAAENVTIETAVGIEVATG